MTAPLCSGCGSALVALRCEGCLAAGRLYATPRKHKSESRRRHDRERLRRWHERKAAQRARRDEHGGAPT